MAALIKASGDIEWVRPQDEAEGFSLKEMHALIDCSCIDVVFIAGGQRMVVDDDACLRERPVNEVATILYAKAGGMPGWAIRGDVLIGNEYEVR